MEGCFFAVSTTKLRALVEKRIGFLAPLTKYGALLKDHIHVHNAYVWIRSTDCFKTKFRIELL